AVRHPLRHEPRGDRREENTVPVMRRRHEKSLDARPWAEDRQAVRRPRTEAEPGAADRKARETRHEADRRAQEARDAGRRDRSLEAGLLHGRADEELARRARDEID